ncbi:hypothetical protein AMATHDRAFT_3676 [Amanita thiersii Skay4041]|uniref:Survival Motor Neuron Gemin2-binding domain-containing protein n=1 Tax=Amanita thiersii Skay4041 TaxID=703135 RepID=A0A2A9NR17_9AGAR|nr:hypothetical protein AMATHDRAFT_3676 [Amanita thiersii Skay4041]
MRQIVSYADIASPHPRVPSSADLTSQDEHVVKKARYSEKTGGSMHSIGSATEQTRRGASNGSRELTHEEIWDDSALIKAWNAATEEYEALNGPEKRWKNEPIHDSPLSQELRRTDTPSGSVLLGNAGECINNEGPEGDSQPLNFDTFIPSYDPSLHFPSSGSARPAESSPRLASINQDEAFSRAMHAMYWSGYWTAVYHCRRQTSDVQETDDNEDDSENEYDNNNDNTEKLP